MSIIEFKNLRLELLRQGMGMGQGEWDKRTELLLWTSCIIISFLLFLLLLVVPRVMHAAPQDS